MNKQSPTPWEQVFPVATRIFVWGILAALIYILRSFFLLIFLTFVFSYIQAAGVDRLERVVRNRIARVVLVFSVILVSFTSVGIFIIPNAQNQAEVFATQFTTYTKGMDKILLQLAKKYPLLYRIMPELKDTMQDHFPSFDGRVAPSAAQTEGRSPTLTFLENLSGLGDDSDNGKKIDQMLQIIGGIGRRVAAFSSAFLLSLLFSFMIVYDLPWLTEHIKELRNTKLGFIYEEVAENIYDFGGVLGKAFEAQIVIALFNTLLTAVGIYMLGLGKKVAFLSIIVFFCSFIPVVGVFFSSVPICLMALQMPDALKTMFLAIILIVVIHLIEGYVLNPKIYGSRMHINPVIVLIILTISGKLFHFWGLILGVPVCTYFFGHAIRYRKTKEGEQSSTV